MTHQICPNPQPVLDSLKDFQRNTVDYVFRRLYTDSEPTNRFLIADEVGLGKTMVARGLIAKAIEHLWNQVERIDIVYICSNAEIARQNIQRLNITGTRDFSLASRITLLPLQLHGLQQNRINFVSFTPGTSFDMKSSLGTAEERILLHQLLDNVWHFGDKAAPLNIFQGTSRKENFRGHVDWFKRYRSIDETLAAAFHTRLKQQIQDDRATGKPDLHTQFEGLCDRFYRFREHIPEEDRRRRNQFVGSLRALLARACISALEPDLIILDEFQRFKHLLDAEDTNEVSQLAHELFSYQAEENSVKVVLLSATPYKMYTTAHEQATDSHYSDFLQTIRFLKSHAGQSRSFEVLLGQYRRELLALKDGDLENLKTLKSKIEGDLRQVVARTERLSASADRNGMLAEIPSTNTKLETQDVMAYLALQQIGELLGQHDTLEYWKSAPYLLNFMENYEIKRAFGRAIAGSEHTAKMLQMLSRHRELTLSSSDLETYQKIDPCNARLRGLMADTVDTGAWQLLWLPPSLPYYDLAGPFSNPDLARLTKRLVFSSWQVVPKVIATLLSYEAERQMISTFDKAPENSLEARKRRRPLLRFGKANNRLTGMPVLGLLYPSTVLARDCDPLAFALQSSNRPTQQALLAHTQQTIIRLLTSLKKAVNSQVPESGPEDETWYWAAPMLLDWYQDRAATQAWFGQADLAGKWKGRQDADADEQIEGESLWAEHVHHAQQVQDLVADLGRPPADLAEVVAQVAIASPAITALRSLMRVIGQSESLTNVQIRNKAAELAWSFRSLFNQPEVTTLLRGTNHQEPYWRRVLKYCLDGGLQSVLDEYLHTLIESSGLGQACAEEIAAGLGNAVSNALSLRTSVMSVDEVRLCPSQIELASEGCYKMRGHFALRFGDGPSDSDRVLNRSEHVRSAFNSPFRPFVLATTSIGQEGLDFHPYCHAVVHWNLPTNPVDLEQREGRIHRYKGHAVRKNLAQKYSLRVVNQPHDDPWDRLFTAAVNERPQGQSDLVPFWIYPLEGGAKIERYVPNYPLSRDCEQLAMLKRSLASYRMVFGQNRQEDLMAYLLGHFSKHDIQQIAEQLRINLEPPAPTALPQ